MTLGTILIVDDNDQNLKILSLILRQKNYETICISSGEATITTAHEHLPDVIILDIMMPDMNGFEVCKELKKDDQLSYIPVIFVSGLSNIGDRIKAFEVGGSDYIIKPFHAEEIISRVNQQMVTRKQKLEIEHLHQLEAEKNKHLEEIVARRTLQLNRLNQRMSAILASVIDAIILIYDDGTISITNNGFDRLFGYLPDEVYGKTWIDNFSENYHDELKIAFNDALNDKVRKDIQATAIRKDGSSFDVNLSFSKVGMTHEENVLCICHDITYLKDIERMKDNFVSMVTHELRTPIAGILIIAKQLLKYFDRLSEEQILSKLNQLHTQSETMTDLVQSILDISRLNSAENYPQSKIIDMASVVEAIVNELKTVAEEKQHQLSIIRDNFLGGIKGDEIAFSRMWRNLIDNAIKYTEPSGIINVRIGIAKTKNQKVSILSDSIVAKVFNLSI